MHKSDMILYRAEDVELHPDLGFNPADLIFIALASGGDYSVSQRVSNHITRANLCCPLMPLRTASKAAAPRPHHRSHDHRLDVILCVSPRMAMNRSHYLTSRQAKLSGNITEDFPDQKVLRLYTHPAAHDTDLVGLSFSCADLQAGQLTALAAVTFQ